METIVAAAISGVVALVVCLINSKTQLDKIMNSLKASNDLYMYRVQQLEAKVDKHNSVVERTFKLESDLHTAFLKIDELRDGLNDLKEK